MNMKKKTNKMTDEHKNRISEAIKSKYKNDENYRLKYRRKHTEEANVLEILCQQ